MQTKQKRDFLELYLERCMLPKNYKTLTITYDNRQFQEDIIKQY